MMGNKNAKRKLTEDQVKEIRAMWKKKQDLIAQAKEITLEGIGKQFNTHKTNVEKIVYYETWRNVID